MNDPGTVWYLDDVLVDDLCTGTEPVPNSATINSPPDGATLIPTFVLVNWDPPAADITKQLVYMGTDGGGTVTPTNVFNGTEVDVTTTGLGPGGGLAPNTTYYWQVVPANCSQTAQNCPIWSFTTNDGEVNYGGGGSTQGGYNFANSTAGASGAPSQPTYSWVDISGTGTDIISSMLNDNPAGPFNIGFTFNYFGNNYTQFYISDNGFISFTSPGFGNTTLSSIPSVSTPDNFIAGYWKDFDPRNSNVTGKHLYYGTSGGYMVITFDHYPQRFGDSNGWITFQIILQPSGNIKIQYNTAGTSFNTNNGMVGIENSDGTQGILYRSYTKGGAIFGSPLALQFGQDASALPVELNSFTAALADGIVNLNWETKTEIKNFGFDVERRNELQNNTKWEKIGFVQGNGNSNSPKQYSFIDNTVTDGKYSYRLKQIDTDGKYKYSDNVEIDLGSPAEFSLRQNYPNPFNPSTSIQYAIGNRQFVSLKVYDILGNEVATLVNEEKPTGTYEIDFDASNLTSGIYFYQLTAGSFSQTKKMLLLR